MKKIVQQLIQLTPLWLRKRIKNIPLLKQVQQRLISKYMHNVEFDARITAGPAKGLNFPVSMPGDKLMYIGTWESEFSDKLSSAIKPGWVCYDIGGYKGYYSGIMALRGAKKVIVFEPMPDNVERIKRLIELNPSLPIQLEEVAVSDTDGNATFEIMDETTMGKLGSSQFESGGKVLKQIPVTTARLDTLVNDGRIAPPDFIKIDVEGAEAFVLRGAEKILAEKKPMLMIEVHSPEIGREVLQLLKPHYNVVTIFENNKPAEENNLPICHFIAEH